MAALVLGSDPIGGRLLREGEILQAAGVIAGARRKGGA